MSKTSNEKFNREELYLIFGFTERDARALVISRLEPSENHRSDVYQ